MSLRMAGMLAYPMRERQFIAMPLMHSEDIADQEVSLAYFGAHLPMICPLRAAITK